MSDKQARLNDKLLPEIEAFKQASRTLQLATLDDKQRPNASYAPFGLTDEGFYILVSDLARHGQNLKLCQQVSVMMIADEADSKSIFARKRLTFDVLAHLVSRDSEEFAKGVKSLQLKHGEMIDNLANLQDFNLYRLTPQHGLYVKGFGQAFKINGADLLNVEWMTDGHHGEIAEPTSV